MEIEFATRFLIDYEEAQNPLGRALRDAVQRFRGDDYRLMDCVCSSRARTTWSYCEIHHEPSFTCDQVHHFSASVIIKELDTVTNPIFAAQCYGSINEQAIIEGRSGSGRFCRRPVAQRWRRDL